MSTEERKVWEKEQRRTRIIEAAERLIFEKGPEETTFADIAKEVGYTKRNLYLYFKDKEDLFLAVVLRGQIIFKSKLEEALRNRPQAPRDTGGKNTSCIRDLGRAFYESSIEHPEYFNLIMLYESRTHVYYDHDESENTLEGPGEDYKFQCRKLSLEYGNIVLESLKVDIAAGAIYTDLTPLQLMLLLWGQVIGVMQIILMRKYRFKETYAIEARELFENLIETIEKGLTPVSR